MVMAYFIAAFILAGATAAVRSRAAVKVVGAVFYAMQAGFAVYIALNGGESSWFFRFDALGTLFFVIMAVVSPLVFWAGTGYLDRETDRQFRLYNLFVLLLCVAITGVYFADNLAVTWIFLEATTLCAAGIVYHRRTPRSLEATWKYLFVCSTGIAIAYLGILLLSTAAAGGGLEYGRLPALAAAGNPLYMKLAFLFMLVGYSCKLEVFPLYTVGVDANSASPAPAAALISTALVNAGFVAVYRVYRIFMPSEIFPWVSNVLIAAGVASLIVGTLFMRRTNHYKRLLAYSTVENMGIVLIGLGIGGAGVFAALLHMTAHSLIKSGMFLQIARVGRAYGSYRINRIGGYMAASPLGAVTMLVMTLLLLAFPPSPLFLSEIMILGQVAADGHWWLVAVMVLLVCVVMYNLFGRIVRMCYSPPRGNAPQEGREAVRWAPLGLALAAIGLAVWQGGAFVEFINAIVQ